MNKSSKSTNTWSLTITLIGTIVFFFLLRTFLSHRVTILDRFFSTGATPFVWFHNKIISPWEKKYAHYKDYKALITERDFYKEQYTQTQAALIQHQATYNFDQATEKLERFSKRYLQNSSFLCKILVHRLSDSEQLIVVNAGSQHGVTKNMLAIYGSTLLGRVSEVFPYYSHVQLITDKRSRISVYSAHKKTKGILEGKNNKTLLSLSYVDCLQPLELNDILISAGEGLLFPEGFCVGKIRTFTPQELHYIVEVEPCYDLKTIDYCYLISPENCSYVDIIRGK
jgi:rod shape-determining protein MreC